MKPHIVLRGKVRYFVCYTSGDNGRRGVGWSMRTAYERWLELGDKK